MKKCYVCRPLEVLMNKQLKLIIVRHRQIKIKSLETFVIQELIKFNEVLNKTDLFLSTGN